VIGSSGYFTISPTGAGVDSVGFMLMGAFVGGTKTTGAVIGVGASCGAGVSVGAISTGAWLQLPVEEKHTLSWLVLLRFCKGGGGSGGGSGISESICHVAMFPGS